MSLANKYSCNFVITEITYTHTCIHELMHVCTHEHMHTHTHTHTQESVLGNAAITETGQARAVPGNVCTCLVSWP